MFWDLRLQKGSSHLMSDNKQRVDQKTQVIPHSVSNVFKYLDQTWNPFFTVMPGLKMLYKAISCQNLIDKKSTNMHLILNR